MILLCERLSADKAETYQLVLASASIPYIVARSANGVNLYVNPFDQARALQLIAAYEQENETPVSPPSDPSPVLHHTRSGIWIAGLLFAIYLAMAANPPLEFYFDAYGASASLIKKGEIHRCITALLVHADFLHVLANTITMVLFGTAVCHLAGWGVGWLLILITGFSGNLITAYLYHAQHLSVGASTAVFGALGLLSIIPVIQKTNRGGSWVKRLIPLGGGLALLGFLGVGPNSDIMAHLMGFLSGVSLGGIYGIRVPQILSERVQALCGAAAALSVSLAWAKASLLIA